MKKLKVVWLCGFTNSVIQEKLKNKKKVGEIAPWISNLIPLFENNDQIELHVISPHRFINRTKTFNINGVTYYFFNQGIPFIGRNWPKYFSFDLWTDYSFIKKEVFSLINKIQPDLIHLHGAENTYHSSAILQFKNKYPVFITVQGIINNSKSKNARVLRRKKREKQIYHAFKHFGYRTETMAVDIMKLNPDAKLHFHKYRLIEIKPYNLQKKYDLVFFARISREKGIYDLLEALSIIKKKYDKISLCVIGGGNIKPPQEYANQLGLAHNVTWIGFLPSQNDVHKMASKAKISVLPTYHDIISGTILESMFLKLPVVAYNVGSIHEVNEEEEIISLVDKLDEEGLAAAIEELLDNPEIRAERAEKGYKRAYEMFAHSDEEIRGSLINAYFDVIDDFHKN